ncbi:MAG: hypothetical protein IPG64_21255 [Haliea sp.]|nr:hypothetical protein [Haliea sp.]
MLWIVLVLIMHAIPHKEVRYLAFLAPITAFVLAPVIKLAWNKRREYRLVIVGLLLIDLMHVVPEAARLYSPYYRQAVTDFFEQLPTGEDQNTQLIIEQPVSFVSPEPGAFFADRFIALRI